MANPDLCWWTLSKFHPWTPVTQARRIAPVVSAVSKPKNDSGVEPGGGSHVPELTVMFSMVNQHDCSMDFYGILYIYSVVQSFVLFFLWIMAKMAG